MKFRKLLGGGILAAVLALGGVAGLAAHSESKVARAEEKTHAKAYYLNIDRYDASKEHTCQWGWWGGTYNNIGMKYSTDNGTSWNDGTVSTVTQDVDGVSLTFKKWQYVDGTNKIKWFCWNTGSEQNQTVDIDVPTYGVQNAFFVDTYNQTSRQDGYWLQLVDDTTTTFRRYLDATNWNLGSGDVIKLHWWDPQNSSVSGDIIATEICEGSDHLYKFYQADLTGSYFFIWYKNSWDIQTADLNPYKHDISKENLCIASSTTKEEGEWLKTDGSIRTMSFYWNYPSEEKSDLEATYKLLDGESFYFSGVSSKLPQEEYGYGGASTWHENSPTGVERDSSYSIESVNSDMSYYAVREKITVNFVDESGIFPNTTELNFEYDESTKQYAGLIAISDTNQKFRIRKIVGENTTYCNTIQAGSVASASQSGDYVVFSTVGTYSVYYKVSGENANQMWIQSASPSDESYMYAKYFLQNTGCDDQGIELPTGWSTLSTRYSALSGDAKDWIYAINISTLKTTDSVRLMIERYNYACNMHSSLERFIKDSSGHERTVPSLRISVPQVFNAVSETTPIMLVVIISVVSLTAVGGYIFLKRRKED